MSRAKGVEDILGELNMESGANYSPNIIKELSTLSGGNSILAQIAFELFRNRIDQNTPPLGAIAKIAQTTIPVSTALDVLRMKRPSTKLAAALWVRDNRPISLPSAESFAGAKVGETPLLPYLWRDERAIWMIPEILGVVQAGMRSAIAMHGNLPKEFVTASQQLT